MICQQKKESQRRSLLKNPQEGRDNSSFIFNQLSLSIYSINNFKMSIDDNYKKMKSEIKTRLSDFKKVNGANIFYELCFCLLTPQSSARRADYCIQQLKQLDFQNKKINPTPILKQKIRFHNHKGSYLLEFKNNHKKIFLELSKITDGKEKRNFLVKNVKGLGLKEASHFLRNTGHENLAILDRHILKNLIKLNVINELPKTLTPQKYFEIEEKFIEFSNKINIPMDELDLLFWSMETGEIFK